VRFAIAEPAARSPVSSGQRTARSGTATGSWAVGADRPCRRASSPRQRPAALLERFEEAVGGLIGEQVGIENDGGLSRCRRPGRSLIRQAQTLPHAMVVVTDQEIERDRRFVVRLCDNVDIRMAARIGLRTTRSTRIAPARGAGPHAWQSSALARRSGQTCSGPRLMGRGEEIRAGRWRFRAAAATRTAPR